MLRQVVRGALSEAGTRGVQEAFYLIGVALRSQRGLRVEICVPLWLQRISLLTLISTIITGLKWPEQKHSIKKHSALKTLAVV